MALWDLDLHGFQDISAFDRSQLLLSRGISIKSKCHDLKLFLDISVGLFVWVFLVFFLCMSSIRHSNWMWIKSCISSLLVNVLSYLGYAFHLNTGQAIGFVSCLAIAMLFF